MVVLAENAVLLAGDPDRHLAAEVVHADRARVGVDRESGRGQVGSRDRVEAVGRDPDLDGRRVGRERELEGRVEEAFARGGSGRGNPSPEEVDPDDEVVVDVHPAAASEDLDRVEVDREQAPSVGQDAPAEVGEPVREDLARRVRGMRGRSRRSDRPPFVRIFEDG